MVTEDEVTEDTEVLQPTAPEEELGVEDREVNNVEGEQNTEELEVTQALEQKEAEFTPNYKFSSYGEEHEIPEFARALIKDAESEKQVKEIFNKATSFDTFKEKDEKRSKSFEEVQNKFNQLDTGVKAVTEAIKRDNWDEFLKSSGIDENWIYKKVLDKVNYNEASPEEKARIDARNQQQSQVFELENKTKTLEQQAQDAVVQAKRYELEMTLANPEIKTFAEAFDAAPGKQPGAFREAIIDQAELAWYRSGGKQDLSAEQAAREVMRLLGNGYPTPPQNLQSGTAQIPNVTGTQQTQPTAKTIIPNVKGKASQSPLKGKAAKSISDLKKIYNERYVAQQA